MPQTATLPTGGGGPAGAIEGAPMPVKLALIGGVAGLAFLAWRKFGAGGGVDDSTSDNTFGIPNTAIMLGSLQQGVLDLKGEVGSGNIALGDMITGGFANMGAQLDALTAATDMGLNNLQLSVLANQDANTSSILTALGQQSDALQQLISGNDAAQLAVLTSLQSSMIAGQDAITAQQNASLAAINALGSNVTLSQASIIQQLQGLQSQNGTLSQQLIAIGNKVQSPTTPQAPIVDWSPWNGSKFYTQDGTGVAVINGQLYGFDDQPSFDSYNANYRGWLNVKWYGAGGLRSSTATNPAVL